MVGHGPGLLRFFKPCRKNPCDLPLPDPSGSLSEKVDSSVIEEANKEVTTIIADVGGKCKPYLKLRNTRTESNNWISIPPWGRSLEYCCPPRTMEYTAPPHLINSEHNVEIYLGMWPTISPPLHKATA